MFTRGHLSDSENIGNKDSTRKFDRELGAVHHTLIVVAASKFIHLQKDAQAAAIHGLPAALKDAAKLVYATSVIAGVETL